MVKLATITAANGAFVKNQPLTAVFVGATNGIGEFTVRELCKIHGRDGPGLKIIIVGRNEKAAQTIIEECKMICSPVDFLFVQAGDISLLQSVDKVCKDIQDLLEAIKANGIDILIQSQGKVEFGGRIDTKEGLDKSMSLLYYSRMRFITNLLPNLLSSTLPTGAKVISIYAGGMEAQGSLFPDDLPLQQHYSFANCRTHSIAMKTMFFENLVTMHPGKLSCSHIYPGLVVHKGFDGPDFPWWFKVAWKGAKPFARFLPMHLKAEEIGQRVLYLATDRYPARMVEERHEKDMIGATDGVKGGGAYSVTYTNEVNDVRSFYEKLRPKGFKKAVLEHTGRVFEAIEKNGIYPPTKVD
ncbi:hypothetical protein E4T44_01190 [Aureobasidium sp. EXF-8845]|nr:hypothetical protein E4T44_01190 [Aureobasidium sp. EXF-8845]KAI4857363.1 hypothetical protein E4T45_01148 [Aureobasidium sp. EXF-8846]